VDPGMVMGVRRGRVRGGALASLGQLK